MIFEFKNEENSSSQSESIAKAMTYYCECLKSRKDIITGNSPCLLASVRSSSIEVHGAVFSDSNDPHHSV